MTPLVNVNVGWIATAAVASSRRLAAASEDVGRRDDQRGRRVASEDVADQAGEKPPGDGDPAVAAGTTRLLGVAAGCGVRSGAKRLVIAGSALALSASTVAVVVDADADADAVSEPVLPVLPVVVVATTCDLGFFDVAAEEFGRLPEDFDGPAEALAWLLCAALSEFAEVPGLPLSAAATP